MDVSELRKGILRALDDARRDASARRTAVDEAHAAFADFLKQTAVPLLRQTGDVLRAEQAPYSVHTPADSARLVSDASPHTYLELVLDTSADTPQVVGRLSVTRGRHGHILEEVPIAEDRSVADLNEDDLAAYLLAKIPKLVLKR
jgi:hypothetical protein